jgi:hypothetical protein
VRRYVSEHLFELGGMVARIVFRVLRSVSHVPSLIAVADPAPIPLEREPAPFRCLLFSFGPLAAERFMGPE